MIEDFLTRTDSGWYDKQGKPVSIMEFTMLTANNPDYRIVQQTKGAFFEVSTVLLGLDHGYPNLLGDDPNYRPVIFETMVFTRWKARRAGWEPLRGFWSPDDVETKRYRTLAQAKGGHLDSVERWTGWNGFKGFVAYWLGGLS